MSLIPSSLDASAPAVRLAAAVAASLALHAAAVLTVVGAPPGSPAGEGGSIAARPLQARIVAPPTPASPSPGGASPRPPPRTAVAAVEQPAPARSANRPTPAPDAPQPLGLRETPIYYLPAELDARPRLRSRIDPTYPQVAPPDGGYVLLRLLISEEGRVERALVVVADPEGYFEKAAAEAFAGARFSPGRLGGVAVKSQTWIEMKFHPLVPSGGASGEADENR